MKNYKDNNNKTHSFSNSKHFRQWSYSLIFFFSCILNENKKKNYTELSRNIYHFKYGPRKACIDNIYAKNIFHSLWI